MQEEHVVEGSPSGQQEPAGRLTGSSQGAEENDTQHLACFAPLISLGPQPKG